MKMYSYNQTTKAISARLAPGLTERIDFNCQQYPGMNRNKFLNYSAEFFLQVISEIQCGNLNEKDLPTNLQRFTRQFTR